MDKDKNLKETLMQILKEYNLKDGPLFNLKNKLRLQSSLIDKYPYLENGDLDNKYLEATVQKAEDIYKHINFEGDSLLLYDNVFNKNDEREIEFIESTLVNIKRKEEYTYEWYYDDGEELLNTIRRLYQVEGLKINELFSEISLKDLGGDYDLVSCIYIIDLESKTIFYFYDDRGLYVMASEEKILSDLWMSLPEHFFEDCHDFEIKIKKLYWIDGSEDNREDLCLHGDLQIRLNDEITQYSPTVSAA